MRQRQPRRVALTQGRSALTIGQQRRWGDLYQVLLTMPWTAFLALMAIAFLGLNGMFGVLYWLDPHGLANARPGSFQDAFFFSVQTIGTLGYGVMAPKSLYANCVVTAETFVGLVNLSIGTGLIFARFSRPTARILFSKVAVIAEFDGIPTFMFRAANQRGNHILEAEVTLTWSFQDITREGSLMRRFQELKVTRSRSPLFALSWLIMHPIDETSPLWGATPESLRESRSEFLAVISGNDESFAQRIFARQSYLVGAVVWDHAFVDILESGPEGELLVDYTRFHDVEDAPRGEA
jgi:inward rectifier potassium channel